MAHSKKQKLQKARAWFKFVLTGLIKPVETEYITDQEQAVWNLIKEKSKFLLDIHDPNSRALGLNVPEYRCLICNKGVKDDYKVTKDGETYNLCAKHFKEEF